MPRPRLTPLALALMERLLHEGDLNYSQIATAIDASVSSVYQHARRLGFEAGSENSAHYAKMRLFVARFGEAEAARQLGLTLECLQRFIELAGRREDEGAPETGESKDEVS